MGKQKRNWLRNFDRGSIKGPYRKPPVYTQFVPAPRIHPVSFQEGLRRAISTDDYTFGDGISATLSGKLRDAVFIPTGRINDLNVEILHLKTKDRLDGLPTDLAKNFIKNVHIGRNFDIVLSPHHMERYLVTLRDYFNDLVILVTNTNENVVEGAVSTRNSNYHVSRYELPYSPQILRRLFTVPPIELYTPSANYEKLEKPIRNF